MKASELFFDNGDLDFYKRKEKDRWLRPGKVISQDGKVVFVRHGVAFIRVSPNRLYLVNLRFDNFELKEKTSWDKLHYENLIWGHQDTEPCDKRELYNTKELSLKKKDQIQYKLPGEEEWITVTILGRAGKTTGTNKTWFNVQDHTAASEKSLDLKTIGWKISHLKDD